MTKTYATHQAKYYLHVYPEYLCKKNNFAVSLAFMLYDMQHLKKREENKNLVY